jgi:hypothetical protein
MPRLVTLPGQLELLRSPADLILFCAGVASGKTQGGARWSLAKAIANPGAVGFIGAQTHPQLTRVALPPFLEILASTGIPYLFGKAPPASWGPTRYTKHDGIFSLDMGAGQPCQIVTGSMENYEAHRGLSLGWAWLDEARDMAAEAFDVILSRFRGQPHGTKYQALLTTTPSGFNWLYQRFIEDPKPGSTVIRTKTTDNPFLPAGFVDRLRAQYTSQFARQEIDGEFVNMTAGQAYYGFKRDWVKPCQPSPSLPLRFSMDFNVSPLCAILAQSWEENGSPQIRILDEIKIEGSGRTRDAVAEAILRMAPALKCREVFVYGDTSGGNRDTRDSRTDYDIITSAFRDAGWTPTLRRNYGNPTLVDSVEACNGPLEHGRIIIDPKCAGLVRDLEKVAWVSGTRVIDKSDQSLTHLSDAFRYFIVREWPLRRSGQSNVIL